MHTTRRRPSRIVWHASDATHAAVSVAPRAGAFFAGRGAGTPAHTHAVDAAHHLFLRLEDGRVFCIPDGYEVADRSLKDIQHVLDPRYARPDIEHIDSVAWARTLDGGDYMPGLVGMNNLRRSDYLAVVLQALLRVPALRCAAVAGAVPRCSSWTVCAGMCHAQASVAARVAITMDHLLKRLLQVIA